MKTGESLTINRRRVVQFLALAGGAAALSRPYALYALAGPDTGYGRDPDMLDPSVPWGPSLSDRQVAMLRTLGDIVIPEDEHSPSASALDISGFVNEWVSAPYPAQREDRRIIVAGLSWLDEQASAEGASDFNALSAERQAALFTGIASAGARGNEDRALFFERLVYLFAGGFYTTPEGMKDLGYVGNVPLTRFDGPPKEVLKRIGL